MAQPNEGFSDIQKYNMETQEAPKRSAGAPPSYDSLFGKLKEAKESSDGNVSFAKKFFGIILGSFACTIILGLVLAIPIACIVIGAIYLHDCPAERLIPIYLIVMGVFTILKDFSSMVQKCCCKKDEEQEEDGIGGNKGSNGFDGLIGCFLFAWFICGNVWIYRTYNHFSTDASQPDYCHPTLYYFAFWLLNSTYILVGLVCFVCCGLCICLTCCSKGE